MNDINDQISRLKLELKNEYNLINELELNINSTNPQISFNPDFILHKIDNLKGEDFESETATLLRKVGVTDAEPTKGSGDYGIDVIGSANIHNDGYRSKLGVQCKLYSDKPVGYRAIEETTSGVKYYDLDQGILLTNGIFTDNALKGAHNNFIAMWNRDSLKILIIMAHYHINISKVSFMLNYLLE